MMPMAMRWKPIVLGAVFGGIVAPVLGAIVVFLGVMLWGVFRSASPYVSVSGALASLVTLMSAAVVFFGLPGCVFGTSGGALLGSLSGLRTRSFVATSVAIGGILGALAAMVIVIRDPGFNWNTLWLGAFAGAIVGLSSGCLLRARSKRSC